MLSARQLQKNIDSLYTIKDTLLKKMSEGNNTNRIYLINKPVVTKNQTKPDLLSYSQLIPLQHQFTVNQSAQNMITALRNDLLILKSNLESNSRETKLSLIEWNRKFSISLSCLILFFLGAPLGAIIRKGGIGLPLVFAIILLGKLIFIILLIITIIIHNIYHCRLHHCCPVLTCVALFLSAHLEYYPRSSSSSPSSSSSSLSSAWL